MRKRVAVLASGGGTNLQAIFNYLDGLGDRRAADIVLVASDRSNAGALSRAASRGVPGVLIAGGTANGGRPLDELLATNTVDLVALAGYLRLVPQDLVQRYHGRMLNIHPALLPAFGGPGMYGARVHQSVIDAGATVSGATVHFVDETYDRGPIIAQWPVPVRPSDNAASLAARVLRVEHALYPRALNAVAAGRVFLGADQQVLWRQGVRAEGTGGGDDWAFCLSEAAGPRLANEIDRAIGT